MQCFSMKIEASSLDFRVWNGPELVTRSSPAHDSTSSASESSNSRRVMREGSMDFDLDFVLCLVVLYVLTMEDE